ncbi:UDP-glucose dehydrogenase family protein [Marinibactrum halimedae]|uniref:UDP-glucose 6-dehydrogenase n=1 Tax=Marinibactrum halimedae TaxID=1444977 RepID=A0AA37WKD3_9GAMM|nr:UDP-glucose/GDP-mannose dehydrogenase family protein [Marinibactrum halimedae]MCD9457783.1 UDP-glucose/GDP-mannose dehydrogenase family protein [Marinibactrum halimedae]GLS24843.1 UDP-glucose 6-dehydrogenase [Marinibactrum halimedae]
MKVTVFGTGYVGLVTGACLAEVGHHVVCVDVDADKVARLKNGQIPIYEPGLDGIVISNYEEGRLEFTTDAKHAVAHGTMQFIAVGTPPDEDGSADLQYVLAVASTIAEYMDDTKIVVTKSTVPVGTADRVRSAMMTGLKARSTDLTYHVASNPEFLKEGAAVADFMKPDRIVVGTDSKDVEDAMRELYAAFNRNHDRMLFMDVRSAELTKYAANAMLATKISFINEVANIAEYVGADIERVRQGIGSDPRIGYKFIYPGCGYGGSCFPKDVKALASTARQVGYEAKLLDAVELVNEHQKTRLFDKLHTYFNQDLAGKTIALWGLAFKPNTDDMREASSRVFIEALWEAGASVKAYDPEAMNETQRIYGQRPDLQLMGTKEACLIDADALVVCTEWKAFWAPDFNLVKESLKTPLIVDGRNIYNPHQLEDLGIDYIGIGRSN